MASIIRKGRRGDAAGFLRLVDALAKFEDLEPPTKEGKRRLIDDVFAKKRINLFVGIIGGKHVGYALFFYAYSSFLARPTLYLEDLFVLEEYRKKGIGLALFMRCVKEAVREGCGRMEWAVLNWNENAMKFYESLGARKLEEWSAFRLDSETLERLAGS